VTDNKHLKARIRARMARTGERYTTARAHLVGPPSGPYTDHGYALRGGLHPDSALIANALGGTLSEAMVLGIGGGLGAGYILWEFAAHRAPVLTLGFRKRWNYIDWLPDTLDRLGAGYEVHRTGGTKGAAATLDAVLAAGATAIVWPDREAIGYWHLPPHLNGRGGHPVLVYAADRDTVRLDDRNVAPLTVDREVLAAARARVGSYRNCLVAVTGRPPAGGDPRAAVRAGIADCVAYLGAASDSFALPAWRKWARMVTDTRNAKAWPKVFADGTGLVDALLSVWEGVEPVGMDGGHLRTLYARFLDEAADLLGAPGLRECAGLFREAAAGWHAVAEAALPADVPEFARLRELTAAVAEGVAAGDAGAATRAEAAGELWELRTACDRRPPVDDTGALFTALAARLGAVYEAERAALDRLRAAPV